MKFTKLIGGGLLATVLALGVGAGLAVRNESKAVDASVVETGKMRVYFDAWNISWVFDDNHTLKLYYWGGSSSVSWNGVEMTNTVNRYNRDIYYMDIPDDTTGLVFGRYSSTAGSTGDPTNRWEISDSSSYGPDDGYNFFQPTGDGTYNSLKATSILLHVADATTEDVYIHGWDGGKYTPDSNPTVPAGKAFDGWYTDSTFETSYVPSGLDSLAELELYAKLADNTYTVSKYNAFDGVKETEPFATQSVAEGATFNVPDRINQEGYHFAGWYLSDLTTAYTAQAINDDLSIYAKYTTLSEDSYIYYLQDFETTNWIKSWDGDEQFGVGVASMGSAITSVSTEVHGVLDFEGTTQYIYKIRISSESGDGHFKFHPNGTWTGESAEKTLVAGAAYTYADDYNADKGRAIDFLLEVEEFRNNVKGEHAYKGLNYSVCGISKDDAKDLVEEYDTQLSAAARGYVDSTNTYTYDPSKSAAEQAISVTETEVSYSDIIAKLREIATGTEPNLNPNQISLIGAFGTENTNAIMIVVIVAVASLTAIGGYFFIKRRKEN